MYKKWIKPLDTVFGYSTKILLKFCQANKKNQNGRLFNFFEFFFGMFGFMFLFLTTVQNFMTKNHHGL